MELILLKLGFLLLLVSHLDTDPRPTHLNGFFGDIWKGVKKVAKHAAPIAAGVMFGPAAGAAVGAATGALGGGGAKGALTGAASGAGAGKLKGGSIRDAATSIIGGQFDEGNPGGAGAPVTQAGGGSILDRVIGFLGDHGGDIAKYGIGAGVAYNGIQQSREDSALSRQLLDFALQSTQDNAARVQAEYELGAPLRSDFRMGAQNFFDPTNPFARNISSNFLPQYSAPGLGVPAPVPQASVPQPNINPIQAVSMLPPPRTAVPRQVPPYVGELI